MRFISLYNVCHVVLSSRCSGRHEPFTFYCEIVFWKAREPEWIQWGYTYTIATAIYTSRSFYFFPPNSPRSVKTNDGLRNHIGLHSNINVLLFVLSFLSVITNIFLIFLFLTTIMWFKIFFSLSGRACVRRLTCAPDGGRAMRACVQKPNTIS